MSCKTHPEDELNVVLIEHRKDSRHAKANRTNVRIRLGPEVCRAATKRLRLRQELRVYFKSDDGLVVGVPQHNFRILHSVFDIRYSHELTNAKAIRYLSRYFIFTLR